jgi:hypothetical protein
MTLKYVHQHFPISGPPKFTQIGILGLKRNHLATLHSSVDIDTLDKKE